MITATKPAKKSAKEGEITMQQALEDIKRAYDYKKQFMQEAQNDVEFALGAQWETEDAETLKDKGVLPLTINEIAPILDLMKGIESQNRADYRAYPEGQEDSVESDIVTRLLKNVLTKMCEGMFKISEAFNDGNTCGEGWLEPYLDTDNSLITSDFGLKQADYWNFVWDPNAREYDLSDGRFFTKLSFGLTKDQVLSIYPDAEDVLSAVQDGNLTTQLGLVDRGMLGIDTHIQPRDYPKTTATSFGENPNLPTFDLAEHYYKKYVDHWYVADMRLGALKEADSKAEAENYANTMNETDPEHMALAAAIKKRVPEIWMMAIVGGVEEPIADEMAWSYPAWKSWPFMPYFAYRSNSKVRSQMRHLTVQGVTRRIKDLNREKNKRRTQELRHLNQSANSGWLTPENAWVDREEVKQFGATPGVNLEYKPDLGKPERILPTPLSQGHSQLAEESSQDIKRASGINTDLLAMDTGGSDSGRAIALRQKQGMVMVQGLFDNLSRTKRRLAKFILSQFPQIYTVERAMRVCGDAFIQQNFQAPVMAPVMMPVINPQTKGPVVDPRTGQPAMQPQIDPATGQPAMAPQIDPNTGQPMMQTDMKAAQDMFDKVLKDHELAFYDVAIGEVVSQETTQYMDYMMLMDMQQKGVPIPPDVLMDASPLPAYQKSKIKASIERMMAAGGGQQQPPPKKPNA